ncbi:Dodecin [BD1-7 clade bacterium]|uniref:Dodecin n=1 Tax=BD1-7 clade bacterium TaxID=2029982 RepID=A0A5S9QZH4_9GAMM|nr:Dodecin [BD1-7 clade bacterium]
MKDHIYKVIEVVGSSTNGSDEAIQNAIHTASKSLDHLDWFEVAETRGHIVEGLVAHWQVRIRIGFRLENND